MGVDFFVIGVVGVLLLSWGKIICFGLIVFFFGCLIIGVGVVILDIIVNLLLGMLFLLFLLFIVVIIVLIRLLLLLVFFFKAVFVVIIEIIKEWGF